jgi:drug/metabolite transporter (DMT)-like permease
MSPLRGILLKLGSVVIFILMFSLVKLVSDRIPPGQAVFFRSAFALPVLFGWLAWIGRLHDGIRTKNPMSHVYRGLVGTAAMGFGFASLAFLPLPEVTAIGYAAPLMVVIFAAMFLGEKVGVFRLSAVALGMTGVIIIIAPRLTVGADGQLAATEALGVMLVLTGALCTALAQIFVRRMTATESIAAIVFWFSLTATALSLLTLPFGWVMPTPTEAAILVTIGLMGGVGQILMTSAYRHADASVVAPFDYASMLFALAIGYFAFSEVPTWTMLAGAALVVAAGVIIILRERHLGLRREAQRRAGSPHG